MSVAAEGRSWQDLEYCSPDLKLTIFGMKSREPGFSGITYKVEVLYYLRQQLLMSLAKPKLVDKYGNLEIRRKLV